jgi:carboxypeptidase C (cathepsin A)
MFNRLHRHLATGISFKAAAVCGVSILMLSFGIYNSAKAETEITSTPQKDSITKHTLKLGGQAIHYTAVAGTITLRDKEDKPIASMFYISYAKNNVKDEANRPVTFVYGGGPGATSTGLQMVGFGPKRVITTNAAHTPPAPYKIVDNQYSLLDATDLVYVEEVDTGFSRTLNGEKLKHFTGVNEDAESFAQFIKRYLTKYNRWNSPKFLMGNSYGTTRSAALVHDLQKSGVDFSGVVFISTVLNFETLAFHDGNDLPYILYLPTYAAVARYHHALKKPYQTEKLGKFLSKVQDFALHEYAPFLLEGNAANKKTTRDALNKLSQYTGLAKQYIKQSDYRVRPSEFRKELLRGRDLVVGRMGGRFVGKDYDQSSSRAEYDPINPAIGGAYTASMNHYLHHSLHYGKNRIWQMESENAFKLWDWHTGERQGGSFNQGFADVATDLRQAMIDNPDLKIFVAHGYYDFATPYFAADYTFNHLNIGNLQRNITSKYYKSGHVMYLKKKALVKMHGDLEKFYRNSL